MNKLSVVIRQKLELARWIWVDIDLARASLWLVMSNGVVGIFGYIFQLLMGRFLTVQEYGLLVTLLAFLSIFSAPMGTLMMLVSRKVSAFGADQSAGSITHLYGSIFRFLMIFSCVLIAVYLLLIGEIQEYFKVSDSAPIVLLGVLVLLAAPLVVNTAFLQGLKKFKSLAFSSVINVALRTIIAVLLVWTGFGVSGALGAIIIATTSVWLITYCMLRRPLVDGRRRPYHANDISFRSAIPVLLANVGFTLVTQLDVILVRYHFTAEEAGHYAAAAILGKAIIYLPGGIAIALFPLTAENHHRGEKSSVILSQAVGLTALVCGLLALFYFLFGEWLVVFLYGEDYQGSGEILKYFGFAIFPMAFVMIANHFLIAKNKILFSYMFLLAAPLQIISINIFHESLFMVVLIIGLTGTFLLISAYSILRKN